jgi:Helix-turn-helix domain
MALETLVGERMNQYYTADEAMKILGKSRATFYREVDAGIIPYELPGGKKRGRLFPKDPIDLHAKIQKEKTKSVFVRSTNADIWQRVQNSRRIYGEDDIVSYKRCLEWLDINNEIFMSMKIENELIGATTIIPLDKSTILQLIKDEIREQDIPDHAIKKWSDPQLYAYIPTIAIIPSGNLRTDKEHGAALIRHTTEWAISLHYQHNISAWYAIGVTTQGQEILEFLGFKEIYSNIDGSRKGYRLSLKEDQDQVRYISKRIGKQDKLSDKEELHDTPQLDEQAFFTGRQERRTSTFKQAKEEDLPEIMTISQRIFGTGPGVPPLESRLAWLRKNPDTFYVLKSEGRIIGYTSMLPLTKETVGKLITEEIRGKDITSDDVLECTPGQHIHMYIMAIGVDPRFTTNDKHIYGRKLISGFRKLLVKMGKKDVSVDSITARSYKPDGIRLLRKIGFPELISPIPDTRLFVINTQESGSRLILEYKEALNEREQ